MMLDFWVPKFWVPEFWVPCPRSRGHVRSVTTPNMLTRFVSMAPSPSPEAQLFGRRYLHCHPLEKPACPSRRLI